MFYAIDELFQTDNVYTVNNTVIQQISLFFQVNILIIFIQLFSDENLDS